MSICVFMCMSILLVSYFYISNTVFPLGNMQRKNSTSQSLQTENHVTDLQVKNPASYDLKLLICRLTNNIIFDRDPINFKSGISKPLTAISNPHRQSILYL